MYSRLLKSPKKAGHSFFLFGPRHTGKTTWVRETFKEEHIYVNLLDSALFRQLDADPSRIKNFLPDNKETWIFIDEVQRVPEMLNDIHYLIEEGYRFILTGSSARKLRRGGTNLLGGRARVYYFHPLLLQEIGEENFNATRALNYGLLPMAYMNQEGPEDVKRYLYSYIHTYIAEEIRQEQSVKNISLFNKFLEVAAFSQGQPVNMTNIAQECFINRLTATNYFGVVEDLLLGSYLPPFTSRAKREMIRRSKFYFFDAGVYRNLRLLGPSDLTTHVQGPALETLVLQHLKALNDYLQRDYNMYYWRTKDGKEVDFIAYKRDAPPIAIEVKGSNYLGAKQLGGLRAFKEEYPDSKTFFVYTGIERKEDGISLMPVKKFLAMLPDILTP